MFPKTYCRVPGEAEFSVSREADHEGDPELREQTGHSISLRKVWLTFKALRYIWKGLKCLARRKIGVPVLDATAIGVSVIRGDFDTAGSVMFLLGVGELLEEWTHKKSVAILPEVCHSM